MTNEEIAREYATKWVNDDPDDPEYDYIEDVILAAINRAQSEDKARLDWLESLPESTALLIRPCNHQVSIVYGNTKPRTYEACTVREAIDAARKHEA